MKNYLKSNHKHNAKKHIKLFIWNLGSSLKHNSPLTFYPKKNHHQTYLGFSVEICWSIFPCNLHISADCLVSPYMLQVPVLLPNTYNCWNSLNTIIQTSSLPLYYLVAPEPRHLLGIVKSISELEKKNLF